MSESTREAMRPHPKGHPTPCGNGRPGSPFARARAERRAAILQIVSWDDICDVSRQYLLAVRCAVLAPRLLLEVVGHAVPPCDPARPDEDELAFPPGHLPDAFKVAESPAHVQAAAACLLLQQLLSFVCQEFLVDTLGPHSDLSTPSQTSMPLDEHLAQTQIALLEVALAARAEIDRATDWKRSETVEMGASE